MSTLSQDATSTSAFLPVATGPPTALTILLRNRIDDMTDFFPFDDLANLSPSDDNNAFTFRGLIEDGIGGSQEIMLLKSGCLVDGVPDCSKACNDTELFFGSMETFYNCAALASISYWTQDSMMYFINEEAERNASAVMGDGTLAGFDDGPVLESFVACALESCRDDGLAVPCGDDIGSLSKDNSSAEEIFAAMANFCPAIEAEINPDIFGPGVSHPFCFTHQQRLNSLGPHLLRPPSIIRNSALPGRQALYSLRKIHKQTHRPPPLPLHPNSHPNHDLARLQRLVPHLRRHRHHARRIPGSTVLVRLRGANRLHSRHRSQLSRGDLLGRDPRQCGSGLPCKSEWNITYVLGADSIA